MMDSKFIQHYVTLALLALFVGCAKPPAFQFNVVVKATAEKDEPFAQQQVDDVANILTAFFGTPDEPAFPNAKSFHWVMNYDEDPFYADDLSTLVDLKNLQRAAGPVSTDENGVTRGLYREHCAHCHGITGDGAGPTAITLNPYPRDFRNGVYKFKSTTGPSRPSDEDLMRILNEGIHGTAMPSFKVAIDEGEKRALIDYVKYLSIRGEVELALWDFTSSLDKKERLPLVFPNNYENLSEDQEDAIFEWFDQYGKRIEKVFVSWIKAKNKPAVKEPPAPPNNFDTDHPEHYKLVDLGRKLFHDQKLGACAQCHGNTGYGDGKSDIYDIWNKWAKGKTDSEVEDMVKRGALPPRTVEPRNFRNGEFRGGRSPTQLFYRINNGITGSEMPGAGALTPEEVWCLVAYVRSIKFEPITGGQSNKPVNDKPIN